jgi:hypothetical protein
MQVVVSADLDHARLEVPASPGIDKAAGVPLHLSARAEIEAPKVFLREATLTLPGGSIGCTGQADIGRGQEKKLKSMALQIRGALPALDRLAELVPGLRPHLQAGTALQFTLNVDSDPHGGLAAKLGALDLRQGGGHLSGTAGLSGWPPREVTFDLDGADLDLGKGGEPAGDKAGLPLEAPAFALSRDLRGHGRLHLANVRIGGMAFGEVRAESTLRGGVLVLKELQLRAGQGTLDLGGTSFELTDRPLRGNVQVRLNRFDLKALGALQHGPGPHLAAGTIDGTIAVEAAALPWPQLLPRLSGSVRLDLSGLEMKNMVMHGTIVNTMLRQAHAPSERPPRDMTFHSLHLSGEIAGGRLRLTDPLRFDSDDSQGSLRGSIGFADTLALEGDLLIKPRAIAAATQGRFVVSRDVPVKVRVTGPRAAPQIEILDLAHTVRELLLARFASRFGAALKGQP